MIVISSSNFLIKQKVPVWNRNGYFTMKWVELRDAAQLTISSEIEARPTLGLGNPTPQDIVTGPYYLGGTIAFIESIENISILKELGLKKIIDVPPFDIIQAGGNEVESGLIKLYKVKKVKLTTFTTEASQDRTHILTVVRYIASDFESYTSADDNKWTIEEPEELSVKGLEKIYFEHSDIAKNLDSILFGYYAPRIGGAQT